MKRELLEKLAEYRSILENDPRIKTLEKREDELQGCQEVASLSAKLKKAEDAYEEARSHYGEKNELTKKAQKDLFEAKLALDSHPIVKSYNEAYIAVKDLYLYIDDILFSDFRAKHACEGEKTNA